MNVSKEKNIVKFEVDVDKIYCFNISTGEAIGLKGKTIKTLPLPIIREVESSMPNEILYRYIISWQVHLRRGHLNPTEREKARQACAVVEKFSALGFKLDMYYCNPEWEFKQFINVCCMIDDRKEFKPFIDYMRNNNVHPTTRTFSLQSAYHAFKIHIEKIQFFMLYPTDEHFTEEMQNFLFCECRTIRENGSMREATPKELKFMRYALGHSLWDFYCDINEPEKLEWNGVRDIRGMFSNYFYYCKMLGISVEKSNNFFKDYTDVKRMYLAKKKVIDAELFERVYSAWGGLKSVETEELEIVFPTCANDLIEEGKNQHNCVGSYINRVLNGDCIVVFIREKNNPTESYITCEIRENIVWQYLRPYNSCRLDEKDREMKNAITAYLQSITV